MSGEIILIPAEGSPMKGVIPISKTARLLTITVPVVYCIRL